MLTELLTALGITAKHLVSKSITVRYPEERREIFPRVRWRHELMRHENGLERCIGCSLCEAACPAHCIRVVAEENTDEHRFSPGERYAKEYEINMIRCIFCGMCQEACPVEAIVLREEFELSDYEKESFIYTKERLLVTPQA